MNLFLPFCLCIVTPAAPKYLYSSLQWWKRPNKYLSAKQMLSNVKQYVWPLITLCQKLCTHTLHKRNPQPFAQVVFYFSHFLTSHSHIGKHWIIWPLLENHQYFGSIDCFMVHASDPLQICLISYIISFNLVLLGLFYHLSFYLFVTAFRRLHLINCIFRCILVRWIHLCFYTQIVL